MMFLAFISNDSARVILWVVLVCAALGLITLMAHTALISCRNKNKKRDETNDKNSEDVSVYEEENPDVSNAGEIVMSRNVIYSVGIEGQICRGKYFAESADSVSSKFNMRVNGLVKEYESGDTLTLVDGDTLSPVSGSVILSKIED